MILNFLKCNNARHILCLVLLLNNTPLLFGQGRASTWLLGYQAKNRITFTDTSYSVTSEIRKIPFMSTEGNISDENGNILMSSNGYFVANATGDTMLNGSGLNPNQCTYDYGHQWGLPLVYANMFLPMPDDTTKYILFHQTCNYNSPTLTDSNIFYSIIDITLNNGLGAVISKNNIAANNSFGTGITACKHANGRDWWIIAVSDSGNIIHKFLLTPNAVTYMGYQNLQLQAYFAWAGQPVFSPDGEKFAFRNAYVSGMNWNMFINVMNFDRCTGIFILDTVINYSDSTVGFGTMFSPDSRYLYFSTTQHIYQVDTDAPNIGATFQTVAINDVFPSPTPPFYTNFHLMYLAPNGKIYITSTNGVVHLHEIDYPDSSGIACNVNLHNVFINNPNANTVPNHPNYYLGRLVGSPCDSLTSVSEIEHDFKFKISPNPNNGNFKIMYLLPQNKAGKLEIFDINGKAVYSQNLPQWSTLQFISLPKIASGVYQCVISSGNERVYKKLVIFKE
jgi:hypothetical protein